MEITPKQKAFLEKRGRYVEGMTKMEASAVIDECLNNKPSGYEKNGQAQAIPEIPQSKYNCSPRDASIIAQTMMKCWFYNNKAEDLDQVMNIYDYFLGELSK